MASTFDSLRTSQSRVDEQIVYAVTDAYYLVDHALGEIDRLIVANAVYLDTYRITARPEQGPVRAAT